MKIIWAPLAIERAYEVAATIAADKPGAALAWLEGLFTATDRIERFPEGGRIVPEIGLTEYREIVYRRSYRIITCSPCPNLKLWAPQPSCPPATFSHPHSRRPSASL